MAWFEGNAAEKAKSIIQDREDNKAVPGKENAYRVKLEPGESKEFIILDSKLSDLPQLHEYAVSYTDPSGKKYMQYETSCANLGHLEDPLAGQPIGYMGGKLASYFVLFATVLDPEPHTKEDGSVSYYKNLLPIKTNQIPDFCDRFQKFQDKAGTLRGWRFKISRAIGDKTPVVGSIQPLDDMDTPWKHYSEQELIAEFGHPAVKSKDGAITYKEENQILKPFQYITDPKGDPKDVLSWPDPDAQRRKYGLSAPTGSRSNTTWQDEPKEAEPQPEQMIDFSKAYDEKEFTEDNIPF